MRRYSRGVRPVQRLNNLRKKDTSSYPTSALISSTAIGPDSRRRLASSTRKFCIYSISVTLVAALNRRFKVRSGIFDNSTTCLIASVFRKCL